MTPDRPGYWAFHPKGGGQPEKVPVDFKIENGKMILFPDSPRWPKSFEAMAELGTWKGEPTAG